MSSSVATVHIKDYTNCLISGIDRKTISECQSKLTFWYPSFRFSPAYKLGRWDGKISLWKNGWVNNSLITSDLLDVIENNGYVIDLVDDRVFPDIHIPLITTEDMFGEVQLRDYQVAAVNSVLEVVNDPSNTWGNGILKMATGAGKSYVCGVLSKLIGEHGRVLVIVPNINLVTQTAASFRKLGIEEVGEFYGEKKEVENITISTWQSLDNYPELLAEVLCVIVDEAHQAKAQVLQNLMQNAGKNVPFRFGCTGSLPQEPLGEHQVRGALGDVLFELSAWELQQSGVLSSCIINVIQSQETRTFIDYHDEFRFLTTDKDRLRWIASYIEEVATSGNTLVLVKNVKTGKEIAKLIGDKAVFISGGTKTTLREDAFEWVGVNSNSILICTKGIAAVGIDIPRIFNLFLVEQGKSFIETIQSIGRGLRRAEDKDHIEIYDLCADTKYSKRHLSQRKKYYKDAQYPFVVKKVTYQK